MLKPDRLGIPFIQRPGAALVARADAVECLALIYAERLCLLGYDAFTLFPDNKLQPHLEWSASYSRTNQPALEHVVEGLASDPPQVTHYEFVFTE